VSLFGNNDAFLFSLTQSWFIVNTNTDYLATVNNYGTHTFQHWQDQPSNTNQVKTNQHRARYNNCSSL